MEAGCSDDKSRGGSVSVKVEKWRQCVLGLYAHNLVDNSSTYSGGGNGDEFNPDF
jgi:hypothetical protein